MKSSENTNSADFRKMTGRHSHVLSFKGWHLSQVPIHPVITIATAVFFCELLDIYIVSFLPPLSNWFEMLVHAVFLLVMLSPMLYFFLYRTLVDHIRERSKAESARRTYQNELEFQNGELRRIRGELEASRSTYFDLFDFAPIGYFKLDQQGLILEANFTAANFLGVKRNHLVKSNFTSFIPSEFQAEFFIHCQRVLETKARQTCQLKLVKSDSSLFYAQLESIAVQNGSGGCREIRTALIDQTDHKRAEDDLRESEIRFRTVFHTNPDSITISRLEDAKMVSVNKGFTALSGYTAEEVVGKTSLDINLWNASDERDQIAEILREYGQLKNFEAKFNRKDGRVITALLSARVIELDNELHILTVAKDISEWELAKEKLDASHRFLQIANSHKEMNPLLNDFLVEVKRLTGCSAIGIRILDGDGNIPYQAYMGFSRRFFEVENPLSIMSRRCMCTNVILNATNQNLPFYTETGSFFTGCTSHFLATMSEEQKGQTRNVCNQFGYESVALIPIRAGDNILGLIHAADPRTYALSRETVEVLEGAAMQLGTAIERVRAEETLKKSHELLEKQVENRTAQLVSANELLNREIKERNANEKKLLEQQDRLRSLSSELMLTEERERRRIATELHDHIGQTLAITKIKLGELLETSPSKSDARALEEIREFIEQTIQDTRSLTFELSPPVLYELGLEAALEWLVSQSQEKHNIRMEFKDDNQSKPLDASCPVIIFQASRELLFNIVKHARAQNAGLSIRRDGETIRIDVEDDGVGFDVSQLCSTVADSCGFGLFSIRERLGLLGGHLKIESQPGSGTRVTMQLPLACGIKSTGK